MNLPNQDSKLSPNAEQSLTELSQEEIGQVAGGIDYELYPPSSMDVYGNPDVPDFGPSFSTAMELLRIS